MISVAGCNEPPSALLEPDTPARVDEALSTAATISALPPCSLHWRAGVSGAWNDPLKWNLLRPPRAGDSVCLDAAGTYTVTLPFPDTVNIRALRVGNGVARVTLAGNAAGTARLELAAGLYIAPRSIWAVSQCGVFLFADPGSTVVNDGLITTPASCATPYSFDLAADTIVNRGTVNATAAGIIWTVQNGGLLQNIGHIALSNQIWVWAEFHPTVKLDGGSITGSNGGIVIHAPTAAHRARVEWNAGLLDTTSFGYATFQAWADTVVLANTALSGYLQLMTSAAETTVVRSDIGPNVHLWADACDEAGFRFQRPGGRPVTLAGELRIMPVAGSGSCIDQEATLSGAIVNDGTIRILDPTHSLTAHLLLDSLVNNDTTIMDAGVDFGIPGSVFRNHGFVRALGGGGITMNASSRFAAMNGSAQIGSLSLQSASLTGTGSVASVFASSSVVAPGEDAPGSLGTLSADLLVLRGSSSLEIEVGGTAPGEHDALAVSGTVSYGGTLAITPVAPYVGGACGEVIPIVTSVSSSGTFANRTGFAPGVGAAWRSYVTATEYDLAGYNPLVAVFASLSPLAVTEGGAGARYSVCVSQAPTAPVTITPTAALGQLAFSPNPIVVPTTGWELPQGVSVSAIDDAVIEPPQADIVSHTTTSADPSFNNVPVRPIDVAVSDNDGSADLGLTVTSSPGPVPVGSQFTVSFQVNNAGPTLSTGGTFTIPPISGLSFVSAVGVTCSVKPVVGLTCDLPGLASGGSVSFTITALGKSVGVWPVTMTVTGHQADPNATNDVRVKNVTVN